MRYMKKCIEKALLAYVSPASDVFQIRIESVVMDSREQIGDLGGEPTWDPED